MHNPILWHLRTGAGAKPEPPIASLGDVLQDVSFQRAGSTFHITTSPSCPSTRAMPAWGRCSWATWEGRTGFNPSPKHGIRIERSPPPPNILLGRNTNRKQGDAIETTLTAQPAPSPGNCFPPAGLGPRSPARPHAEQPHRPGWLGRPRRCGRQSGACNSPGNKQLPHARRRVA